MKTLKLGKDDFKKRENSYLSDYIGAENIADFDGHLEIEGDLGWVFFESVKVAGSLGIEAGSGIKAGEGIEAGWGIKAGFSIHCKLSLKANLRIFAGLCMWRFPYPEEREIVCTELKSGTVAFGTLKLIEAPKKEGE